MAYQEDLSDLDATEIAGRTYERSRELACSAAISNGRYLNL
jgi:hypothetical protein